MNRYVGKICPYCKTIIKENDDVFICRKCEMPHHKDCWIDNKGCTTFGCDGSDTDPNEFSSTERFCPDCGALRLQGDIFCGNCGHDFSKRVNMQLTHNGTYDSTKDTGRVAGMEQERAVKDSAHSILEYVYKNKNYYEHSIQLIEQGKNAPFNWAAFLLGIGWFAYRKMYGTALFFCCLALELSSQGIAGIIACFCLKLYIGFSANKMYYNRIKECQTDERRLEEGSIEKYFGKHKGTSVLGSVLFLAGFLGAIFLLKYRMGA